MIYHFSYLYHVKVALHCNANLQRKIILFLINVREKIRTV